MKSTNKIKKLRTETENKMKKRIAGMKKMHTRNNYFIQRKC